MSIGILTSIAAGGALGALSRHGFSVLSVKALGYGFPWATLIVNVAGSFMMGVLIALFALYYTPSPELRAFLTVGFLGGLTTFSAFSLDAITLLERGAYMQFIIYSSASVFLSLAALFAGLSIIRYISP